MNQFFKTAVVVLIAFLSTHAFAETVITNGTFSITDKSWETDASPLTGGISFTLTEDNQSPINVKCPFEAMKISAGSERMKVCTGEKYEIRLNLARGTDNGTAMHVRVDPHKFAKFPISNFRTNNFDDINHFKEPVKPTYKRHSKG